MDHDFGRDVLSNVLNQHNDDELKVVADQVRREAASGRKIDEVLTEAQFALGLSFSDAKRLEAMAKPVSKTAADSTAPMGASEPPPEPELSAEMQALGLDQNDPVDMGIIDFLGSAQDAGIEFSSALKMLADRAEDLAAQATMGQGPEAVASLMTQAGLKSTLRKLRQQLNKHDNEDVEGMSKLITCIEGIEKQLDRKQKAKEDRAKKKEPAKADDSEEKEAEAAAPEPGGLPADDGSPEDLPKPAPSVMPDPVGLAADAIDFGKLKSKIAALKADIEKAYKLKEKTEEFESKTRPLLLQYLETLEDKRMLIEHAEQKWSLLRVQEKTPDPTLDKSKLLDGIKERIAEGIKKGEKFAEQIDRSIKAMERHPSYQTPGAEKAPYLKIGPSPKGLENVPHNKVPPRQSSLRATADMLSSLFEGLSEAISEIVDLVDVAEHKLQPAF